MLLKSVVILAAALFQSDLLPPPLAPIYAEAGKACDGDQTLTTNGILVCEFFYRKHGRKPTTAELEAAEPEWDRATTKALLTPEVKKRAKELERCEDSGACTTVYVSPW